MALIKNNHIQFEQQQSLDTETFVAFYAMGSHLPLGIAPGAISFFRMGRIDKAWFIAAIERSRFGSQRQLAPHLKNRNGIPITTSNFCRMLSGERAMLLHEAQQLAKLLEQPLAEVLAHAGVKMNGRAMSPDEFARRLQGSRRDKATVVADLLRSLGYGDGADLIDTSKPKPSQAG